MRFFKKRVLISLNRRLNVATVIGTRFSPVSPTNIKLDYTLSKKVDFLHPTSMNFLLDIFL